MTASFSVSSPYPRSAVWSRIVECYRSPSKAEQCITSIQIGPETHPGRATREHDGEPPTKEPLGRVPVKHAFSVEDRTATKVVLAYDLKIGGPIWLGGVWTNALQNHFLPFVFTKESRPELLVA